MWEPRLMKRSNQHKDFFSSPARSRASLEKQKQAAFEHQLVTNSFQNKFYHIKRRDFITHGSRRDLNCSNPFLCAVCIRKEMHFDAFLCGSHLSFICDSNAGLAGCDDEKASERTMDWTADWISINDAYCISAFSSVGTRLGSLHRSQNARF